MTASALMRSHVQQVINRIHDIEIPGVVCVTGTTRGEESCLAPWFISTDHLSHNTQPIAYSFIPIKYHKLHFYRPWSISKIPL
jgi:hypothetical protein